MRHALRRMIVVSAFCYGLAVLLVSTASCAKAAESAVSLSPSASDVAHDMAKRAADDILNTISDEIDKKFRNNDESALITIFEGKSVNLDEKCTGRESNDECRTISAIVVNIGLWATNEFVPSHYDVVAITGAHIIGDIRSGHIDITRALIIQNSQIDGAINLVARHGKYPVKICNTRIEEKFEASNFRTEEEVDLSGSTLRQGLSLRGAKLDHTLNLSNTTIYGPLDGNAIQVGGGLLLRGVPVSESASSSECAGEPTNLSTSAGRSRFESINLVHAKIDGVVDMSNATFTDGLDASEIKIGRDLQIGPNAEFGALHREANLELGLAHIGNVASIQDTKFFGRLNAPNVIVGSDLVIGYGTHVFRDAVIDGSQVDGNINLSGVTVDENLSANSIHVHKDLIAHRSSTQLKSTTFVGDVNLNSARIDGALNLSGAVVRHDLSANAIEIGSNLFINSETERFRTRVLGKVNLAHATVGGTAQIYGSEFDQFFDAGDIHVHRQMLLGAPGAGPQTLFSGVDLSNATIDGSIQMDGAWFRTRRDGNHLSINAHGIRASDILARFDSARPMMSIVDGDADFGGAKTDGNIEITGGKISGLLNIGDSQIGGSLLLGCATPRDAANPCATKSSFNQLDLHNAVVKGRVELDEAILDGQLTAQNIQIGAGGLSMGYGARFHNSVDLSAAKIDGSLNMAGADTAPEATRDTVFQKVDLSNAVVLGDVQMGGLIAYGVVTAHGLKARDLFALSRDHGPTIFMDGFDIGAANIPGDVVLSGSIVIGLFDASSSQIGGKLLMGSAQSVGADGREFRSYFNSVNLQGANVAGSVSMAGASFLGDTIADELQTQTDLLVRDVRAQHPIEMHFVRIARNLDLRGSTFAKLDLSGATIGTYLMLGPFEKYGSETIWKTPEGKIGNLDLRNVHVRYLVATDHSWPDPDLDKSEKHLQLAGFYFDHVTASSYGETSRIKHGDMKWWDEWARLDHTYSAALYDQIAPIVATGDPAELDDLRFLNRERETEEKCHNDRYSVACISLWVFRWGAGFGIGDYALWRACRGALFTYIIAAFAFWGLKGFHIEWPVYWRLTRRPAPKEMRAGFLWCCRKSLSQFFLLHKLLESVIPTDFLLVSDATSVGRSASTWQRIFLGLMGVVSWLFVAALIASTTGLFLKL